jgi:RecA-family ATPase
MVGIDLQSLAQALGGEVSAGQVLAPGPGHSKADRSLSVKLDASAPDGFIVHSFANDNPIECKDFVRAKLSLPAFKPNGNGGRRRASTADISNMLAAAMESIESEPAGRVVAAYDYTDDQGELLYQVLRYEPKDFRGRRPDGNGGWIPNAGERRVLYRLPELLKYPDACVFICEGEKDAGRVASLDHCAVAVAFGKWTDECIQALTGRDVLILEDADKAGRKKALAAAAALYGTANTIRIVRLPGLTGEQKNKDVSDWLDADTRNASKFADVCFEASLWTPEKNNSSNSTDADPAESKPEPLLAFINAPTWEGAPMTNREWIVPNRVPAKGVTLLSGDGGVGKTILALHLSAAVVLGRDWLGSLPDPGPAIVICCEDDVDELHRRYFQIISHYGVRFTDLAGLHLLSLAGEDALFAVPDKKKVIAPTKLFARLRASALDLRPRLIVIDNSADVYGGNENDRSEVRQFVSLLHGLALASDAGVLLTSHPSLTGMSSCTGLSGSTAWNASVRSRMYLKRATTEKDEEPDPDLRVLEVMKANYGPVGETVTVRWRDGLFLPVAAPGSLERMAREQKVDDLFLKLLDRFTEQGRNLSDKKTAHTYAPSRFASEPEAKANHISKRELAEAMERLFRTGKICNASYGLPSKGWTRLERK